MSHHVTQGMKPLFVTLGLLVSASMCPTARADAGASDPADDSAHWVVGVGSSSMFGSGATVAPFLNVLVNSLGSPPWLVRNEGVRGICAAECLQRWRTLVRGRRFGSFVLMCGLNDVRNGRSAAETWATLKTILDEAVSDGLRVVAMTLQPFKGDRAWTPEKHHELLALNASIRAYCEARRLVCVDAYVELNDPANDGALRRRYDSGDHLHFSQAAHDLIGRRARAAFPLTGPRG